MGEQTMASEQPSSNNGIDVRKAMDILNSRSQHHDHHSHSHECQHHKPEGGEEMGQTIDLMKANEIKGELEEKQRDLQKEREERSARIKEQLKKMSVKKLLREVLEAQTGRVTTYREYDKSLDTILKTGNMTMYPASCAKATAAFSVLSDTINAIQTILKDNYSRSDLVGFLKALQQHEREKLNLTAAWHLERIRHRNQEMQSGDERELKLLKDG